MKSRSGLHKQVSSIFDGTPLPVKQEQTTSETRSKSRQGSSLPLRGDGFTKPGPSTVTNNSAVYSRAQASSDPKYSTASIVMLILLAVLFVAIVYWLYLKPPETPSQILNQPAEIQTSDVAEPVQINWPEAPEWPLNMRDPMTRPAKIETAESVQDAPTELVTPQLKGIVYRSGGQASALFGQQIVYEGDSVQNHKVEKIMADRVILKNEVGEEKVVLTGK
ncbi:hypothetical protein STSP2_02784 [Anaerohalosphaera lusitana]|uniref:Type II secretion system protein GspC N-terminal domain-containing protein n=1 Tax=Anaerohalosphaera lusitana TaxID=1936003 RepID=A0A1U9NNU9_9BACT|nr:type II secretion system protein N [Anaerohalosphaera lusitana]AQT69591.1 hypothetical protein STSP2_02784 [Anaerohalosphaera lusitana]